MSERPVPRRESPWGLSGDDHRQPKAHRCNDRAEDVIQACFKVIRLKQFLALSSCSGGACVPNRGKSPTEPFTYLDLDPPKREVKLE